MSNRLLAEFFTIAQKQCADYAKIGPGGKVDYCYGMGDSCILKEDKFCRYFGQAVIGYKPFRDAGLQQKWQELSQGTPKSIINRICGLCGEEFRPTSPRQRFCHKCKKLNKMEKARLRKRRQRDKIREGSNVTLLDHK